jgi:hypothetical protein
MGKLQCLDSLSGGGWMVFIAPNTIPAVVVDGHNRQSGGAPNTHCSLSGACHVSRPLGFGVVDR